MATHAATVSTTRPSRYFVPAPSAWPFVLTIALGSLLYGVGSYLEDRHLGPIPIVGGALLAIFIIFRWFHGVARESETGQYNAQVDQTYRWGMSWFIFSEVMFFGAFFGALFYTRELSVPWLGGEGAKAITNYVLWPNFDAAWPTNGPGHVGGSFDTISPWSLPLVNTILLLTSSVTITFAHHAIKENHRRTCILWMCATIALGITFLYCQATEYLEAYKQLNLTLGSGVYGSTFFMLTGFHGLHVTLGTIMMISITGRLIAGHFKPDSHFGFEGVAWYWHFVDVVWVGLFIFVYIL
jgi:cytochrome c oxidase subunit 3